MKCLTCGTRVFAGQGCPDCGEVAPARSRLSPGDWRDAVVLWLADETEWKGAPGQLPSLGLIASWVVRPRGSAPQQRPEDLLTLRAQASLWRLHAAVAGALGLLLLALAAQALQPRSAPDSGGALGLAAQLGALLFLAAVGESQFRSRTQAGRLQALVQDFNDLAPAVTEVRSAFTARMLCSAGPAAGILGLCLATQLQGQSPSGARLAVAGVALAWAAGQSAARFPRPGWVNDFLKAQLDRPA